MARKTTENNQKTLKFKTKKSLGQHFLNNSRVPRLMTESAGVGPGDIVLEVGPGTGVLTSELLARGATVIALEADMRAVEVLRETFESEIANENLVIMHTDARTLDLSSLHPLIQPGSYKVVANIPYYLSGHLFRTFLETDTQPTDLVFLVQKEVAERIARETKESLLSLSVKVYGTPTYVKTVARGNFTPPPAVDSAIIAVRGISKEHFRELDEQKFFTLLHEAFKGKRKQLVGALSTGFPRARVLETLEKLSIRSDVRAEDVPHQTWLLLARDLFLHT